VRISVLLPFRNASTTIGAAIRSILAQDESDFELLAVDDGSDDGSAARATEAGAGDPRLRLIADGRGLGLTARLNQLIDAAQGELFARMDADDAAHPSRLRLQRSALDADESIDLIGSAVVVLEGDEPAGIRRFPLDHDAIVANAWRGIPIVHPTFMGRASWFRRHRYHGDFVRAQDQELLLRTHRESRFANLPDPLLAYRTPQSVATARDARRTRRRAVRRHVGAAAALALGVRDTFAFFTPPRIATGLEPLSDADRDAWRTLARSGRWPDPRSAS